MSVPTSDEQITFLLNIQRLLREGQFTATYKYALLQALADLTVEQGDDSGDGMSISLEAIGAKFVSYYWRQSIPYSMPHQDGANAFVLKQNTDRQAAVIRHVLKVQGIVGTSLAQAIRSGKTWDQLVRHVSATVKQMPLFKLQVVGRAVLDFLYEHKIENNHIFLRPGVAYCLRRFHGLLTEMIRSGWANFVRRQNLRQTGRTGDLMSFLFGTERSTLAGAKTVFQEIQDGRCLYCGKTVRKDVGQVDHFIPWSMYPLDLGHNYVWAHSSCNLAKSDKLAAEEHLESWIHRNQAGAVSMQEAFEKTFVPYHYQATLSIAGWAYSAIASVNGLAWIVGKDLEPLTGRWKMLLTDK